MNKPPSVTQTLPGFCWHLCVGERKTATVWFHPKNRDSLEFKNTQMFDTAWENYSDSKLQILKNQKVKMNFSAIKNCHRRAIYEVNNRKNVIWGSLPATVRHQCSLHLPKRTVTTEWVVTSYETFSEVYIMKESFVMLCRRLHFVASLNSILKRILHTPRAQ